MTRLVVLGLVSALAAAGCYRAPQPDISARTGPATVWAELPADRTEREGDWRDTRILPEGSHRIALGAIPGEGALRLAFSPRRSPEEPVRAWVYAGDHAVEQITTETPLEWVGGRLDLSAYAGQHCDVIIMSDAPLSISWCELVPAPAALQQPNVLVFLVDTLRQDHLSCYGYERVTSPRMDAMVAEGIRFDTTISQSSWTRPAVASLFTSTYPSVHATLDRSDILPSHLPTMAKVFRDAGYETQGFMSNPTCLPMWGFGEGYSRYLDVDAYIVEADKDRKVVDAAITAIRDAAGRPWMFYVHAIGPHNPYEPPPPHDKQFMDGVDTTDEEAHTQALYDGEIAFTDAQFGRLLDELKALGLYDETIIAVVSDHGEQFWEHGEHGHGVSLHDEEILVPFLLKPAGSEYAPRTVTDVTELIDVAPTLLELAGISRPRRFQGESVVPAMRGEALPAQPAYASLFLEKASAYSARTGDLKLIKDIAGNETTWFDLISDPGERAPLAEAPAAGMALQQFASRVSVIGGSGLHIRITGSLGSERTISGTIMGEGLGEYHLRYNANNGFVEKTDGGVAFSVTTSPGPNSPKDLVNWHEDGAEQNNAHIRVAADGNKPVTLTIDLDGAPAPATMVFTGSEMTAQSLTETTFRPLDLAGDSDAFRPMALPRRLAVYVWYVPGAESVEDERLDPDMADALRALGYL